MRTSKRGIRLIKSCEGLRLEPYLCSAGVATIGYGSTGPDISMSMEPITRQKAEMLLAMDIRTKSEKYLNLYIKVEVNQHQYDALSSFCFNVGGGNFRSSTLLHKLNKGDFVGAANEFWKWRRAGGKILPGLVKRRELEKKLFNIPLPKPVEPPRDSRQQWRLPFFRL